MPIRGTAAKKAPKAKAPAAKHPPPRPAASSRPPRRARRPGPPALARRRREPHRHGRRAGAQARRGPPRPKLPRRARRRRPVRALRSSRRRALAPPAPAPAPGSQTRRAGGSRALRTAKGLPAPAARAPCGTRPAGCRILAARGTARARPGARRDRARSDRLHLGRGPRAGDRHKHKLRRARPWRGITPSPRLQRALLRPRRARASGGRAGLADENWARTRGSEERLARRFKPDAQTWVERGGPPT